MLTSRTDAAPEFPLLTSHYATLLDDYRTFGTTFSPELDEDIAYIDSIFPTQEGSRDLWYILGFRLNQLTEWDGLTLFSSLRSEVRDLIGYRRLAHVSDNPAAECTFMSRIQATRRKIEFAVSSSSSDETWLRRFPGVHFMFFPDFLDFLRHSSVIGGLARNGQRCAVATMVRSADTQDWTNTCEQMFQPFNIHYWLLRTDGKGSPFALTEMSHGIGLHDI